MSRHKEKWDTYFNAYMTRWMQDPLNRATHMARCVISNIRLAVRKDKNLREPSRKILERMVEIGWKPADKDSVINHVVSLRLIYEHCPTFDKYLTFHPCNVEVVSGSHNNSYESRCVGHRQVDVARELERVFPEDLKGFEKFVKSKMGVTY
jgi:hypothetical protein